MTGRIVRLGGLTSGRGLRAAVLPYDTFSSVSKVPSDRIVFPLSPRPPFRLDLTAWALRRRPDNVVDRWDGRAYHRAFLLEGAAVAVAVVQTGPAEAPRLRVTVAGPRVGAELIQPVAQILERVLGLNADLDGFYAFAASDGKLAPLVQRFRGLKPPRFPTLFEALVNGIACQQVTLTLGIRLLNRLAERFGAAAGEPAVHAFPCPEDLAGEEPEALRQLGFSRQKARALIELGRAVAGGFDLERLAGLDDEAAAGRLRRLRGVGRWTAEYALLRGMGRTHVFPGDDVGARNHLQNWLELPGPLDYDGVHRVLQRWQPFGGLVYFHLLLKRLAEAGYLE